VNNLTHLIIEHSVRFAKTLVLCVVFSSVMTFPHAQVHANFTAIPAAGCAPLVVIFNDISTGNPSSWKWDLGNGTISFLQNPSATYFNPGQYNIKLVVRNSQGADSIAKSQLITVYSSPQVNFSATPQSGVFHYL